MSEQLRSGRDHARGFPRGRSLHASLARALHDHGHGLHHGLHGRGARRRHAGQRGDPRRRCPPRTCSPARPGGASSRWCKQDIVLSQILTREAFENAIRVNGGIGGSTNAVVHLIAMARRIGVELSLDDWDRLGSRRSLPRRPDALGTLPDGGFLRGRRPARGAPGARRARPAAQGRADGQRPHDLGEQQGRGVLEPRGDPRLRRAVQAEWRHRRPARQPRAERRHHQALGRLAAPDAAYRPRGGVRVHRGPARAHQRRRPRHRRDLHHGPEELRAEGLPGHGRGRQHAAAARSCSRKASRT